MGFSGAVIIAVINRTMWKQFILADNVWKTLV
jgi:hypothetical protein